MSHWDDARGIVVHWPTKPCDNYPGWQEEDCGCCAGLEWGGDCPRECHTCSGVGIIYHHLASGVLAQYPGGPFVGRVALAAEEVPDDSHT